MHKGEVGARNESQNNADEATQASTAFIAFLKMSISVCRPYSRRPVATLDQRDAMLRQAAVPLNARVLSLHSMLAAA